MCQITADNIFREAQNGNIDILKYPLASKIMDSVGCYPLHYLSFSFCDLNTRNFEKKKKDLLTILKHPEIGTLKTGTGTNTPLHILGFYGFFEILDHKGTYQALNNVCSTPLHYLAVFYSDYKNRLSIVSPNYFKRNTRLFLNTPEIETLKNDEGETPLHEFVRVFDNFNIDKKIKIYLRRKFKEKYFWFDIGKEKITQETVDGILKCSKAERFVLGCS